MAKRKRKAGRTVDDRKVLQGVQFYDDGAVVTVTDPDELEARMTPEQCERFLSSGVIEGEAWEPAGDPEPPMVGSPRHRAAVQSGDHKALDQMERERAAMRDARTERQREAAEAKAEAAGATPSPKQQRADERAARDAEAEADRRRAEQEAAQPPTE